MYKPDTLEKQIELFHKAKVSWLWHIYIPSYQRAGIAPFINMLYKSPKSVQRRVHLVVRPEELHKYRYAYPESEFSYTIVRKPGVAAARSVCMRDAESKGISKIIMSDDDMQHIHPLRTVTLPSGKIHAQRYSHRYSGVAEPIQSCKALALASRFAELILEDGDISYGALRNDLFSGSVDTSTVAFVNRGAFPSCLFLIDLARFSLREYPEEYAYHGEDLAMFLHNQEEDKKAFVIQNIAYDQSYTIESTIDLDPESGDGRQADIDAARIHYPKMYPYLRNAMKNKDGGVKRVGFYWKQLYKNTGISPEEIKISDLF